jgi:transcriptional regulator with XRE-family HTH domain
MSGHCRGIARIRHTYSAGTVAKGRFMLIQKLRLKRGWSQEQLAKASGLNVRTIQRIEAGQPASTETLKSIAAVFEVDFSTLNQETVMNATTAEPVANHQDQLEREAFEHVRRLRGFYVHLIQYVVVIAGLAAINLIVSPKYLWFLWAAFGWGIGLLMHGFRTFSGQRLFGPDWERQQVEKRLGRPL